MSDQPAKPFPTDAKADALVRIVHPTLAARKLGVTVDEVLARRRELGLPPVSEQFPKAKNARVHR
jgi:hypothetical protein